MNEIISNHTKFISIAREINRALDTILQRNQLSASRLQILMLILNNPHGQIPSALANQTSLSQKTLSFHLSDLEDKGLIKRNVDKDDRRSYRFTITAKGRDKINRLTPTIKNIFSNYWGTCSESDLTLLNSILIRLDQTSQQSYSGLVGK